jgi:chromosome segregation ATPase
MSDLSGNVEAVMEELPREIDETLARNDQSLATAQRLIKQLDDAIARSAGVIGALDGSLEQLRRRTEEVDLDLAAMEGQRKAVEHLDWHDVPAD